MSILFKLCRFAMPFVCVVVSAAAGAQQAPSSASDPIKEQQKRTVVQPGNNAPVWREVRKEAQEHYTSVKGRETGVLVQSAGETWRQIRNGPIMFYGGWLLVLCVVVIAAIYFGKGPIKVHEKPTGRRLPRFTTAERWAHWTMGISFCVLGVTGSVILFGKHILLPVIGYTLFSWLTALSKNLHNFIAPLFILSLLVFIVMYARDNLPQKGDGAWLATAWRMFVGGEQPPSGRFNAGEKVWFWVGVVLMCLLVSVSGLVLLFPNFDQVRATMQLAHIVHVITAILIIGYALAHIYMGTIGVEGAYENMRDGTTDEAWARGHHKLWYDEVSKGAGGAPVGGAVPAGAPHSKQD